MNERFKQMAEEAFFDESTDGTGQKMYMFGELKMQKFAELIVRECAAVANINSHQWQVPGDFVLEHFGME